MARGEIARLFVAVGADVREAVRALNQVRGDLGLLQRDSKRSADAWTGFTGTLARTGLAVRGIRDIYRGVRDVAGGIGSLALAADDQRTSMAQLVSSIENTGRAVDGGLRQRLEETIDTMSATTLFTEHDLRQALQVLVVGTEDVDDALNRLGVSADLATREEIGLSQAARLFGRINDDTLTTLRKYGIGLDDASENAGELAAAQMLAARAGISVSGAMKVVGKDSKESESIRKRWGIPDPKDMKGALNEAALLSEAQRRLGGGAKTAASGLRGEWSQVGKGMEHVKEQLGELMLPVAKGAVRFLSDGLKGVRRLIMLFSTDISGPRVGGVRKIWKEVFGTEMPAALKAVVDGFNSVRSRISDFVKDINSTDDDTVRGAIKKLFGGLKDDIAKALGDLGAELDKQGLPGLAIKVAIASITLDKFTGGLISPASMFSIVKDALQIAWLTVALGGGGLVLTVAGAATLALGALALGDAVAKGISSQNIWDKVVAPAFAGIVGVTAAFAAGASLPVTLTVGATVVLAFGALTFSTEIGTMIGGWWKSFREGWEKARADFITWWNTTSPSWMPKIEGPKTGIGTGPKTPGTEWKGGTPGETGQDGGALLASLEDIVAAYARVTGGGKISDAYARAVLAQGFTVSQALRENIFTGTVTPGGSSTGNRHAMGGFGVVTKPTLFMAGERGAEQYRFTPVGQSGGPVGGAGGATFHITIAGDVDSRSRVSELGREFEVRAGRLLGVAV